MANKNNILIGSLITLILLSLPLIIMLYIDFLYFHILIEAYTIVIGATIFVITINSRQYFTNSFFLIIGMAFSSVAFIDFVHSLAYNGMNVKDISSANTASQLWILSRYIHAFSILGAVVSVTRQIGIFPLSVAYTLLTLGGIGIIINGYFPIAYIEGHGQSTFKIVSEFVVIACFMTSFFMLNRLKALFDGYTLRMLQTAVLFSAGAEAMFALYINVFSILNAAGHFLKMTSFYFFYRACVYMSLNKPLESIFGSLNENKRFLNNIIESLSYPFYVINTKDYSIKLANSATGLSKDTNTTCHAFTHGCPVPCSTDLHPCPVQEIKRTKRSVVLEHIHIDETGQKRNVEVHAYPIFDNSSEVEQIIEYCFDITEKKKERELIKKLSLAIEQSSNSIIITDSEGIIEYVNTSFSEVTGYKSEEVIGKKPSIFKSGVTPPEVYYDLWKTIKSGMTWKGELCNKKKNGDIFWEAVTISPLKNDAGKITHFVGVREDIQERIRADAAELRANEKERRIIELEKELQGLDHLIQLHQPTITARAYGHLPFRENMPELFEKVVKDYINILERYIDLQIFKVDYNINDALKDFTDRLGMLKIGARDLIDIHTTALRIKTLDKQGIKNHAYREEGRMMVLELMGYLVNYYRNYFIMTSKKR